MCVRTRARARSVAWRAQAQARARAHARTCTSSKRVTFRTYDESGGSRVVSASRFDVTRLDVARRTLAGHRQTKTIISCRDDRS